MRLFRKLFFIASLTFATSSFAYDATDFRNYLSQVKIQALSQGISERTIDKVLTDVKYLPKVVKFDRRQSEFTVTFEKYQQNQMPASRVKKAVSYLRQFESTFDAIEQKYQVPREMVVALWAIESNFGRNMGNYHVPSSLATLAYDGRRREMFQDQLIKAIKIIDEGHITASNMRGSWAGAMGQSQFMPSSFLSYAVDHTQDGTKDIWRAKADVWASIANYLKTEGWQNGKPKSVKVILPENFDYNEDIEKTYRPLSDFQNMGVTLTENISGNPNVKLIMPDRSTEKQAFVVFENFYVILHWNRSYFFALSAAKLADKIKAAL